MHIDWTAFTPGPALFGGVLLGFAAALSIHFHGRILGISGIVGGLFWCLLLSLIISPRGLGALGRRSFYCS